MTVKEELYDNQEKSFFLLLDVAKVQAGTNFW